MLTYDMHELLWPVICVVILHEVGIWEDVVELGIQGNSKGNALVYVRT